MAPTDAPRGPPAGRRHYARRWPGLPRPPVFGVLLAAAAAAAAPLRSCFAAVARRSPASRLALRVRGGEAAREDLADSLFREDLAAEWSLERHGFEFLRLPLDAPTDLALLAGEEMSQLARHWRPIKNGGTSRGRRQSYLRMRGHRAPIGLNTAAVLSAAESAVRERLGADFVLNDCVAIANFEPDLPRQELHRDVGRDADGSTTHGLLVPLAPGACLHVVPASHAPRTALRGTFARDEVLKVSAPPGWALLWDGMLVHAGDGAAPDERPGAPNRIRLHAYAESVDEDRPFDDKGDREIAEVD